MSPVLNCNVTCSVHLQSMVKNKRCSQMGKNEGENDVLWMLNVFIFLEKNLILLPQSRYSQNMPLVLLYSPPLRQNFNLLTEYGI